MRIFGHSEPYNWINNFCFRERESPDFFSCCCRAIAAVAILKVIFTTPFDVIKDSIYFRSLWYNFECLKRTLERFIEVSKDLMNGLPLNCLGLETCQTEELKETFLDWLENLKSKLTQSSKIHCERKVSACQMSCLYMYIYVLIHFFFFLKIKDDCKWRCWRWYFFGSLVA